MILFSHIWRLMTFRHDLEGLRPNLYSTFMAVAIASGVVSSLRWGVTDGIAHFAVIAFLALIASPRLATAYALLSIGMDSLGVAVGGAVGADVALELWEVAGAIVIILRDRREQCRQS